jgi:hypothetical protein
MRTDWETIGYFSAIKLKLHDTKGKKSILRGTREMELTFVLLI